MSEVNATIILLVLLFFYVWDVIKVVNLRQRIILKLLLGSFKHVRFTPDQIWHLLWKTLRYLGRRRRDVRGRELALL